MTHPVLLLPKADRELRYLEETGRILKQVWFGTKRGTSKAPLFSADGPPVCGQSDMQSNAVTVTPGNTFAVGTLSFSGCS